MTMKRSIDVNLDELDQIIDRSTRAPLSESEGQKLILPVAAPAVKPGTSESLSAGHGRNRAAASTGANKVAVAHATLHSGDQCPEFTVGRNRQRW